jgi:hypothetical protein
VEGSPHQSNGQASPTTAELLAAARRYRASGYSAIPLLPGTKQVDWMKLRRSGALNAFGFASYKRFAGSAPSDRHLDAWFGSACNLGIVPPPGVVVLDFDDHEAYEEWARVHPDIAGRTPTQRSRRGHHVAVCIEGQVFTSKAVRHGRVVGDVLTDERWVAAWPSVHPSGRLYEWLPGLAPWECRPATVPSLQAVGIDQRQIRTVGHRVWIVIRCLRRPRRFAQRVRRRLPWLPGWRVR